MTVEIEKGIPLPPIRRRGPGYPFKSLSVGESFVVPDAPASRISANMSYWARKLGTKYTIRKIEEGYRVWRIK